MEKVNLAFEELTLPFEQNACDDYENSGTVLKVDVRVHPFTSSNLI